MAKKKITLTEEASKIKAEIEVLKEKTKILAAKSNKPKKTKKIEEKPTKAKKTTKKTEEKPTAYKDTAFPKRPKKIEAVVIRFHNESEKPRLLEVITDNDYNQDYLLNYFDYIK